MGEILVTSATIKNKAEELQGQNNQLKTEIQSLVDQENALKSEFVGEASDAFHSAFQQDIAQLNKFVEEINRYVQVLQQIGEKYVNTEQVNVSTATSRTYK